MTDADRSAGEGEGLKHQDILNKMTIEEKAAILSGKTVFQTWDIKRLALPSLFCADGPHGLRKQAGSADHLGLNASVPATCFPTASTVANSWDEKLAQELGRALGQEAAAQQVDFLLGPGLNIKRSPLCGRNFEYFSEDPYLSGKMAAACVRGIQKEGVSACVKHFAVNSQELRRMAMNAVVDERTLREIYLTGFEIAVEEGRPGAVMTSYNEVNGTYANENHHLLKEILRQEWGFEGIVITDWGGSNDHVQGVKEGSNLEMPSPGFDSARSILKAVEEGRLSEKELDECVDPLVDAILKLKEERLHRSTENKEEAHHLLAKRAAAESAVLLKNDAGLLPLSPGKKVAVIGDFAFTPRYQGAGSSAVNPPKTDSIVQLAGEYDLQVAGCLKGYERRGKSNAAWKKAAVELAGRVDVVLYFFGLNEADEGEGRDRQHLAVPSNQLELLYAMAEENPNIVGILSAGAVVDMSFEGSLGALLYSGLAGQAGAGAVLDLLTGKANPSGKLAESYPVKYGDTPAYGYFPSEKRNSQYRENLYVGYRYYDTVKLPVRYPFGYGLSYTAFAYGGIRVTKEGAVFWLENTGSRAGAEIAQLYVGLPGAKVFRPEKELKGFRKVWLEPGEKKEILIPFDSRTFRYWNRKTNKWEREGGVYWIMIGSDSRSIRLKAEWKVEGSTEKLPYEQEELPCCYSGKIASMSDHEFETLLGYELPPERTDKELTINDAVCQMKYARSLLARLVYFLLTGIKDRSERRGKPDLNILFIYNIPFRGIAKLTGGLVSMEMAEGLVMAVNGHFFRGITKVVRGFFYNRRQNKLYKDKLK